MARQEAEHKAERQARERLQAAERGRRHGGGWSRAYGYTYVYEHEGRPHLDDPGCRGCRHVIREEVNEPEAEIIRESAGRVLAGESLASLCKDLKARGVVSTAGKPFTPPKIRRILMSARISGRRELNGEILSETADWPTIISPEDSDKLRTLLGDPSRRYWTQATGRSYVLSGILRCGVCGSGLVGRPRHGKPRYVCSVTPGADNCGRIVVSAERADGLVRDLALATLDSPEMAERLRARDLTGAGIAGEIARLQSELEEIAADKASGLIARREWLAQREVVAAKLESLKTRQAREAATPALAAFTGPLDEMRTRWDELNVAQRRAIVAAVLVSIKVNPANPHRKWDPGRFRDPVWRV